MSYSDKEKMKSKIMEKRYFNPIVDEIFNQADIYNKGHIDISIYTIY